MNKGDHDQQSCSGLLAHPKSVAIEKKLWHKIRCTLDQAAMKIRSATRDDTHLILAFLQKKADFDRSVGAFTGWLQTSEQKIQMTLFGATPFAYVLFAEQQDQPIGFALYGFRYSSFVGQPSIWLDDLYVNQKSRSQGAGTALMQRLARIAVDHHCTHIAWTADTRNTHGLEFYHRLGAEIIKREEQRCFWQWDNF